MKKSTKIVIGVAIVLVVCLFIILAVNIFNKDDQVVDNSNFINNYTNIDKENETSYQNSATVEERKEETGLTISHPRLVGVKQFYDHNHERYLVFFYTADKFTGTVKASDEGTLTWMTKEELQQHKLAYNFDHDLPVFFDPNVSEHMLDGKRDELF